jgi:catechol 2,3-dioxygenase-like lactoylglutathione lyase family enzyme
LVRQIVENKESDDAMHLSATPLFVHDQSAALDFFVSKLGFVCTQNSPQSPNKRRITVAPNAQSAPNPKSAQNVQSAGLSSPAAPSMQLLLVAADTEAERQLVGRQAAGKVWMYLTVDNIETQYQQYRAAGVVFEQAPTLKPHGTVAVFLDIAGNRWDLIQTVSLA